MLEKAPINWLRASDKGETIMVLYSFGRCKRLISPQLR